MRIQCVSCGAGLEVPRDVVGKMTKCSACESVFQVKEPPPSRVRQIAVAAMVFLVLLTLILSAFGAIAWDYWNTRPTPEQSVLAPPHETHSDDSHLD